MVAVTTTSHPAALCAKIALPLVSILEELRAVLLSLPDHAYSHRAGPTFASASIGGHVRHCLDHVRAVVDGRNIDLIDYDHRARGTAIETDPAAALGELDQLITAVAAMAAADASELIEVAVMPTRDGQTAILSSTLARELAFVLSHTIHHNATIRAMAIDAGHAVPAAFGYAPSTLAHKDLAACAR